MFYTWNMIIFLFLIKWQQASLCNHHSYIIILFWPFQIILIFLCSCAAAFPNIHLYTYLLYNFFHNIMMTPSNGHALLALCEGNPPVTSGFASQRPVTQSFDIFFDLCLNKWLSKQSQCQWFEMPLCSLWCHCNVTLSDHINFFLLMCCCLS